MQNKKLHRGESLLVKLFSRIFYNSNGNNADRPKKRDLRAAFYASVHSQKLKERNAKGVGNFIENGYVGTGSSLLPFGDRLRRYSDARCQIVLGKPRVTSCICDLPAQNLCVYHLLTPCALARTRLCNRRVRDLRINRRKEPRQIKGQFLILP